MMELMRRIGPVAGRFLPQPLLHHVATWPSASRTAAALVVVVGLWR